MREIGAFEAKSRFGTLLDWVGQGEEVVITRRGKVVARLVGPEPVVDREAAHAAVRRMRARAEGLKGGMTLDDILALRDEGRR